MPNNKPPLCPKCKKPMQLWFEFKDHEGISVKNAEYSKQRLINLKIAHYRKAG